MAPGIDRRQVADDVFAFTGTDVNWVLVRDGDRLVLIDAGWHGDAAAVVESIRSLGRDPRDVEAVLLTHAHADHVGAVNLLHDRFGVGCLAAAAELPNATGAHVESARPGDIVRQLYRPATLGWAFRVARAGAFRRATVTDVQPFPASGLGHLPGRPEPIPTPGHTSGHTAYLLPGAGVVVTGDALVTAHPTLRRVGPQLLPGFFSHDVSACVRSLETLAGLDAETVLPGHGPAWPGPIRRTAEAALGASGAGRPGARPAVHGLHPPGVPPAGDP